LQLVQFWFWDSNREQVRAGDALGVGVENGITKTATYLTIPLAGNVSVVTAAMKSLTGVLSSPFVGLVDRCEWIVEFSVAV
jgi:hypothetical protein